jgi:hypothetical protein
MNSAKETLLARGFFILNVRREMMENKALQIAAIFSFTDRGHISSVA